MLPLNMQSTGCDEMDVSTGCDETDAWDYAEWMQKVEWRTVKTKSVWWLLKMPWDSVNMMYTSGIDKQGA